MLWHISNTTVRTPYRLQDALRVLRDSSLNGNLNGHMQETMFAKLLHETGVVDAERVDEEKDISDLGRKWRVALSQLGFITPKLTKTSTEGIIDPVVHGYTENIAGLSGKAYEITPNGHRLANAETIPAQQECFLRSISAYCIPSAIEDRYKCITFSPLRFVLNILFEIEEKGEDAHLKFEEFALFVQTSSPEGTVAHVVTEVLKYREERTVQRGNVRAFDRLKYTATAEIVGKAENTLRDYADLSFRYLKATGIFKSVGRGICINSRKKQLALLIANQPYESYTPKNNKAYFQALWNGANLPTDDAITAHEVVTSLAEELTLSGIPTNTAPVGLPVADLEQLRHAYEERISQLEEEKFAVAQANKITDIAAWMDAIAGEKTVALSDGTTANIPRGERPAYLEWIVWRAFLAINSLIKPAWECRNFSVDQDFMPIHCAPGGRPDMVFEFDHMVLVVEVTLTSSSRQEAAEGEPVRRHVAKYAAEYRGKKEVYGLFVALQIDSNTAHTFSSGIWYLHDDSKIPLLIVPMTLSDFKNFILAGQHALTDMPQKLRDLLVDCRVASNHDAPQWKEEISKAIQKMVRKLSEGQR